MATLTPAAGVQANGVDITPAAVASGGDVIPNVRNNVMIYVANANVSNPRTITVAAQTTNRGAGDGFPSMTLTDLDYVLGASEEAILGPFPAAFNNSSGQLELTYSDSGADLTIAPFTMPG